jgi:cell division protein FtsB
MSTEVIIALIGIASTAASGFITFFLTKKKYDTEVDSQQIKNLGEAVNIYKQIMEESAKSQKDLMENTIASQNQKIEELQKENSALKQQVNQLQMQMINILGSICFDATCKSRKMDLSYLKMSESGIEILPKKAKS